MSTCNRLDLQTLGSQPVMPKNLPIAAFNYQQLYINYHLMTLGVQVHFLISWHKYVQECYEVHAYVTQWFAS